MAAWQRLGVWLQKMVSAGPEPQTAGLFGVQVTPGAFWEFADGNRRRDLEAWKAEAVLC